MILVGGVEFRVCEISHLFWGKKKNLEALGFQILARNMKDMKMISAEMASVLHKFRRILLNENRRFCPMMLKIVIRRECIVKNGRKME